MSLSVRRKITDSELKMFAEIAVRDNFDVPKLSAMFFIPEEQVKELLRNMDEKMWVNVWGYLMTPKSSAKVPDKDVVDLCKKAIEFAVVKSEYWYRPSKIKKQKEAFEKARDKVLDLVGVTKDELGIRTSR
jgi:hypothetical protein